MWRPPFEQVRLSAKPTTSRRPYGGGTIYALIIGAPNFDESGTPCRH